MGKDEPCKIEKQNRKTLREAKMIQSQKQELRQKE